MNRPFPSEEEQIEVRNYVLYRPLIRPNTDVKKIMIYTTSFIFLVFLLSSLFLTLLFWCGLLKYFIDIIPKALLVSVYYILFYCICLILVLKKALIGCIKCYQHYASESTRRRCLCKPTCSEYAIIVLKKHCLFKALHMIRIRLFKTCRGNVFHKDEP